MERRVLLLGLDCASPDLIFNEFHAELPNLSALMGAGTWGILRSSLPCITVPAWASMTSSRDPGVLGIYGFRNRASHDYDALSVADASALRHKRLWDFIGDSGKASLVLNVPQTYPVRPLNGHMISGFLTPDTTAQFAFPAIFKQEVLKAEPGYSFDVRDFRNVQREELAQRIVDMTDTQYRVLESALQRKEWDFAMHVNMGVDRMHHAFWRYHDPQHRLHEPQSPLRDIIREYYRHVDDWIGRLMAVLDDHTAVIIASDHGVKRMDGAIAINEWLWRNGWLSLKHEPDAVTKFSHELVDWNSTRAWSTGGYYGRVFLNVQGREQQGIIAPEAYEATRNELAHALRSIPDHEGNLLDTRVYKPEEVYQEVNNVAPDLMVYFGNLHWRAVGSIGYGRHYTLENDTGPDDANHAEEGMFIVHNPRSKGRGQVAPHQLMDIAPTVLSLMQLPIPVEMQGRTIEG